MNRRKQLFDAARAAQAAGSIEAQLEWLSAIPVITDDEFVRIERARLDLYVIASRMETLIDAAEGGESK